MPRFKRQLSQTTFQYLQDTGSFILPEIKSARSGVPYILDIQFRENDEINVYMGLTSLLTIKIDSGRDQLSFSANQSYSDSFLGRYKCSNPPKGGISEYLKRTIPKVNSRYFYNMKEGYLQNMICYEFGERAKSDSPFIVIDRECVIGYDNTQEKETYLKPITDKYLNLISQEKENDPKTYGKSEFQNLGDELDLLAIDSEGNLCCIELKHGSNTSGIYWGIFQLAVYREIFNIHFVQSIFQDIKDLISQKIALGLLPINTGLALKNRENFNSVRPILGIGAPNLKSSCWGNLDELMNKHKLLLNCEIMKF